MPVKLRSLSLGAGLSLGLINMAFAQTTPTQILINQPVMAGSVINQAAGQHVQATNQVRSSAMATYRAGQSVTLLPGFRAEAGSVFLATIQAFVLPSDAGDERELLVTAYPNPVGETVTIHYTLPAATRVSRTLTNEQGQILQQTIGASTESSGRHQVKLDMHNVPAGVYLLQFQTDTHRRLVRLLKF